MLLRRRSNRWCVWLVVGGVGAMAASFAGAAEGLLGTQPLEGHDDYASVMVEGIDRFLLRETEATVASRAGRWHRDLTSAVAYEKSVAPNREHLARMLGVVDARVRPVLEFPQTAGGPEPRELNGVRIRAARWGAIPGIWGEGLLVEPVRGPIVANVIAVPDADESPEALAGLRERRSGSALAMILARSGCRVIVPEILSRSDNYSVTWGGIGTNQTHREFVYRPAFEMGRHPIGYEVQKILGAADALALLPDGAKQKVGVFGYGEGGLLALYAGALDPRLSAVGVSGYFDSRQDLWREPIYRNVFGLLTEFGDAEMASLVAPRALVIEACVAPEVQGAPTTRPGRRGGAAPGRLTTPKIETVRKEVDRARALIASLPAARGIELAISQEGGGPSGTDAALASFLKALAPDAKLVGRPLDAAQTPAEVDPERQHRQVEAMSRFTQDLLADSQHTRDLFWAPADRNSKSPEKWLASVQWYRENFENQVIGRIDHPLSPPALRTRLLFDQPKYRGYEVLMDVFAPDVIAYGILLVPKDISPGEHRAVVVCQHGLEGRPTDVADPSVDNHFYHRFACRLAEEGFVTYAPQNPYIFGDRFRLLQRKANPLGLSLYSLIVAQHRQTTEWLAGLPFVDPNRIAFYGLSYGGKTAMRVPALVPRYCLSICSGDFNEWIWKNVSLRSPYSFAPTGEYEMFEWNLGNTFNYAEIAGLIAPRPFMVERGHHDNVAPDDAVAGEFARVRLLYSDLGIEERAEIEFFDGPHTIHGVGTFAFLRKYLGLPSASPTTRP